MLRIRRRDKTATPLIPCFSSHLNGPQYFGYSSLLSRTWVHYVVVVGTVLGNPVQRVHIVLDDSVSYLLICLLTYIRSFKSHFNLFGQCNKPNIL